MFPPFWPFPSKGLQIRGKARRLSYIQIKSLWLPSLTKAVSDDIKVKQQYSQAATIHPILLPATEVERRKAELQYLVPETKHRRTEPRWSDPKQTASEVDKRRLCSPGIAFLFSSAFWHSQEVFRISAPSINKGMFSDKSF